MLNFPVDIFGILFYQPIYNLLVVFYRFFNGDLALAIVAVALVMRIIIFPLTKKQISAQEKIAESSRNMNAEIAELKQKYKNDKEKLNAETLKVQQKYLPQQLGCLGLFAGLFVQSAFFLTLYSVLNNLFTHGKNTFSGVAYPFVGAFAPDEPLNATLLGVIDLGKSPGMIGYQVISVVLPYIILVVLAAFLQYVSLWLTFKAKDWKGEREKAEKEANGELEKKKEKKQLQKGEFDPDQFQDTANRINKQMMFMFPAMVLLFGLQAPAGLAIYWTVQSAFVIIQMLITQHQDIKHGYRKIKSTIRTKSS